MLRIFKRKRRTVFPRSGAKIKTQERQLVVKLVWTLLAIASVIAVLIISLLFFGPKIGGFFGILSKNRDENVSIDDIVPTAPIFSNAPTASKDNKIELKGFAEAGTVVKLFVNGPQTEEVLTDAFGTFTFRDISLIKGHNTIFAKAKDGSGNESVSSVLLSIVYDKDEPEIIRLSPKEGEIVQNLDKRILVKGSLNKRATVKVNDRVAVLKPDLTFEILLGVEEGTVTIKVEAVDEAGNVKVKEFTVTYRKGS